MSKGPLSGFIRHMGTWGFLIYMLLWVATAYVFMNHGSWGHIPMAAFYFWVTRKKYTIPPEDYIRFFTKNKTRSNNLNTSN